MPENFVLRMEVEIVNLRAVRALAVVNEFLAEMLETFPGRPDVERAGRAARYAARHLTVRQKKGE
jgi:hypothetical protein